MDRSKIVDSAGVIASTIIGLDMSNASIALTNVGFSHSEIWEIISAHVVHDVIVGSADDITSTLLSSIELTKIVDAKNNSIFEKHCVCKRLDASGKCNAFCFHNRLKSPGVMVDCIGIESGPQPEEARLAMERRIY